ncbi:hypothetical protein AB670_03573 [Chryseobacterium sp. MOF25P]|uniref:hypothetical protein n=1 Tax=unclassified Chryseobacterium TaxID=2593645 RepID=UPI000805525B|nr:MULTISPECIES: hypothetical protein [unclassified Chryseobacterium]OBW40106.1 hypothetical protein AB670_03573 [Chryseobacterium sp. MOF25P]OBW47627.1 hypothetical protein AB671_00264 [Chryseobacterium sp. BGARF1]
MENMNEQKLKLIQKIIRIDNIQVLLKIEEYIAEFEKNDTKNIVSDDTAIYQSKIHFTNEQLKMIKEAEQDIENGDFYTDEEVKKMTEEWLK